MTTMRGRLSAVEDEWHIAGIPYWLDPVFTFQRTWYPDMTPPSVSFNATLAKVFGLVGGGLFGYYVWEKTHRKVYTGLAGAAGLFIAPMFVAAYDHFQGSPMQGDFQIPTQTPGVLAPSIKTSSAARAALVNTVTENLI